MTVLDRSISGLSFRIYSFRNDLWRVMWSHPLISLGNVVSKYLSFEWLGTQIVVLFYCIASYPLCEWGISSLINRNRRDIPWHHHCKQLFLWKQWCYHSSSLGIWTKLYLNKQIFTLLFSMRVNILKDLLFPIRLQLCWDSDLQIKQGWVWSGLDFLWTSPFPKCSMN